MAGGIDWFRWHHGSVTDPKFGLIAKKAGARLGDVLAVWAFVLESASSNEQRGTVGQIDSEALEYLLDLEPGAAFRILDAMSQRGLLGSGGVVVSWEKRQPKREDETAADRKRRQREREHQLQIASRAAQQQSSDVTGEESRDVTQCHYREEKSREEERREEGTHTGDAGATAAGAVCVLLRSKRIATVNPGHLDLKALIEAGTDIAAFDAAADIAIKAGHPSFAYVLGIVKRQAEDSQRMAANARASPPQSKQTALESRNAAAAARILEKLNAPD